MGIVAIELHQFVPVSWTLTFIQACWGHKNVKKKSTALNFSEPCQKIMINSCVVPVCQDLLSLTEIIFH